MREEQSAQLIYDQYERRRAAAHARMRLEEGSTLYASTLSPADVQLSCSVQPVPDTPGVLDRIFSERADGTLLISIGDGTPAAGGPQDTSVASPYWPQTLGPVVPPQSPGYDFAATHADLLNMDAWGDASSAVTAPAYGIPYFPSASEPHGRQGIAQVVNRSAQAGVVRIVAIDDSGRPYGPLALFVKANETVLIDSDDLENGNAEKGLFGGTGPGVGDWRLKLSSDLQIEALSYVRSWDGVLSAMHDVVSNENTQHRVPIFNPASDWSQESRLRLSNPGAEPAQVSISGIDNQGNSPGTGVSVTIPAGASLTYSAAELESGRGAGLRGSLGEGTGAWQLLVESGQPLTVMNLLSSPTGHLTNLSTVPLNVSQSVHDVPLFPGMSNPSGRQGLVRVINRTGKAGDVHIKALDDTQWDYAPLVLSIGAGEAVHFDSNDLEQGNAAKGLVGGTGSGQGDWRLELTTDLDIEVLSYVRAWDGLLTSMHDVTPSEEEGTRHRLSMFNLDADAGQQNRLRLINPGRVSAEVAITGVDAAGRALGGGVTATIPAGAVRTYTAAELAAGGGLGLQGSLGDAKGEWQLSVVSEQPIRVMSLFASATGHLTNLSTAPVRALATAPLLPATDDTDPPAEETPEDVFESEVSPIVQAQCILCHMQGRAADEPLSRLQFSPSTVEGHVALNLAMFEALIAVLEEDEEVEDPVAYILNKVQGVDHGGGMQLTAGTDDYASLERFLGLLGEAVAPVGITPETLFDGVTMESARSTLRRAAIVFAGRVPTDAEYAAIQDAGEEENGSEEALRTAIRGLMTGPGFHEFLIRASNDRLLTDGRLHDILLGDGQYFFVDFTNLLNAAAMDSEREMRRLDQEMDYGAGRAPLELIAHVVENDLPYTEILTADYIMANPTAAKGYGASTEFDDPDDVHEFNPSEIVSYYRNDESKIVEENKIIDPGDLSTHYPHAGILNTTSFLIRYPTTATNRNRARSRWTYYHFLGLDVEKSAPRTTDPVALADTDNPTMNNPACTVCHTVLDPVAGAFQNYGDEGYYRDGWEGLDSLDGQYKDGIQHATIKKVNARSWEDRETLTLTKWLAAGNQTVALATRSAHNIHVDHLTIRDGEGNLVSRQELEEFTQNECGGTWTGNTFELIHCPLVVPIETPSGAEYEIETAAYVGYDYSEVEGVAATLAIWAPADFVYQHGDTWYRDMREPGFAGELAPNADNSLQWLAKSIVADPRFAEAAVNFWWPAIMGSEIAEAPEDETDADFDGRLLASNAQTVEITRLAQGFRKGFHGRSPYNAKDLLVEIVLSKWFRANFLTDVDPVRRTALAKVGARRLLTPEELSRKTLALTGFQWGRYRGQSWRLPHERVWSALSDTENGYGLLYGGIDSDGITMRARDFTSVMAGVAQSHALQTSYPIVMREFYLLPEKERRLFGGSDKMVTPTFEFGSVFDIEAASHAARETVASVGNLTTGEATVRLAFINNETGEDADRNLRLDRLDVRDAHGSLVVSRELEDVSGPTGCEWNTAQHDHFAFYCNGALDLQVTIPLDGLYSFEVVAWADQNSPTEFAKLALTVEADSLRAAGASEIKAKLVELYSKLHGIQVTADSPEVQDAFALFVEVWERKRGAFGDHLTWNEENISNEWASDHYFFDGIADDLWREELDEDGNELGWDWDRINDYFDKIDWSDPQAVARTWTVVLAYLMMDYRYLYL